MRIDFEYTGGYTVPSPLGPLEFPPQLSIWFRWEPSIADDNSLYVSVGQHVEVALTADQPALVRGVGGLFQDLAAWRLVPGVIGDELWQEALRVVKERLVDHYAEVDPAVFDPVRAAWADLQGAGRSGGVRSLPSDREDLQKMFALLRSNPELERAAIEGFEQLVQEIRDERSE